MKRFICEMAGQVLHPIPGHPELPVEEAAEIKILPKEDLVPLDM